MALNTHDATYTHLLPQPFPELSAPLLGVLLFLTTENSTNVNYRKKL
jgi:hypothetical protein